MNWIFLNKNNSDEYIEMFARGSGVEPTCLETWNYNDSSAPLVIRGIMKQKIINQCWNDRRLFFYMDSGYLGNRPSAVNPKGWKHWHRIVPNNLQHDKIIARPNDRWNSLGIALSQKRQSGSDILIVAPDDKPCTFYGTSQKEWLDSTIDTIKQYTDRKIKIRERPASRQERKTTTAREWLKDVHAVVTFNSIAATESIIEGVPVFVTAPCNAARPVSNIDLRHIDAPWFPDNDLRYAWVCHLAYGQFHISELENGVATKILKETVGA